MVKYGILTARERRIIEKRLKRHSLSQNESNILSKSIRPKLMAIRKINAKVLLNKLEYNQISKSIENKIKKIVLENIKNIDVIVIYGSAIQNNYKNYNDIDVLVITNNKTWKTIGEKYDLIIKIADIAKAAKLNLDIQILNKKTLYDSYPASPSLIYQLKDSKVIYGRLNINNQPKLSKLDLRMKLDWSAIDDGESDGRELYQSLRNIMLVRLLLKGIVDNYRLIKAVNNYLGRNITNKLKNNTISKLEKKLVLKYISELSNLTDNEIRGAKWERIAL